MPPCPLPTFTKYTDYFSMATLIYWLLVNSYPFSTSASPSLSSSAQFVTENELIKKRIFPPINGGNKYLPQKGSVSFSMLPKDIQEAFQKTFVYGADHPTSRVTPIEWMNILYGPVQWSGRLRTLLGMMQSAESEPESPGMIYLALILHYVEQECRSEKQDIRPRNETVEQICAYLAANYQQKFSLTDVAARFYLSPYYLSRLFRRVTGQSIVDYINGRRIEAAQRLLESTDLNISAVAEQTGFASAAHFRRVFRETMGTGPLQYRKSHRG